MVVYTWKISNQIGRVCDRIMFASITTWLRSTYQGDRKNKLGTRSGLCQDAVRDVVVKPSWKSDPLTPPSNRNPLTPFSPRHVEPGNASRLNGAVQVLKAKLVGLVLLSRGTCVTCASCSLVHVRNSTCMLIRINGRSPKNHPEIGIHSA